MLLPGAERTFRWRRTVRPCAHYGRGILENLNRILPDYLNASIDLRKYDVPEVFRVIAIASGAGQDEMLRTSNFAIRRFEHGHWTSMRVSFRLTRRVVRATLSHCSI